MQTPKPNDLVEELCLYLNCNRATVEERLCYGTQLLAKEWEQMSPQTPDEIIAFYRNAENYIFDLANWHQGGSQKIQNLIEFCQQRKLNRILDYGCGIGEEGIALAEVGFEVTMADVPGKTFDFAKWRVRRRDLRVQFIDVVDDAPLKEIYDCVFCFEVLEHLWEPAVVVQHIYNHLLKGGFMLVTATFHYSSLYPMHLAKNNRYQGEGFLQMMRKIGFQSIMVNYGFTIFHKGSGEAIQQD